MMEKDLNVLGSGLTLIQRVAICFAAGVIGALAVLLFSHVLFALGLSQKLGVNEPISFKSPDVYRPLFWGGLWGIPFGIFVKAAWTHLYLFSLLLPRAGAGAVSDFPAHERRGIIRAAEGPDVRGLSAAGQSAFRDRHRSGRKGDHRGQAVGIHGGIYRTK